MSETDTSIGRREVLIAIGRPACGLAAWLLLLSSIGAGAGIPHTDPPFLWLRGFRLIVCEEPDD